VIIVILSHQTGFLTVRAINISTKTTKRGFNCGFKIINRFDDIYFHKCSAVAEISNLLATIDMGQKFGGCAAFFWRVLGPI